MFIAFTDSLKYNQFNCGETPEIATQGLVKDLVEYYTEDAPPAVEFDDSEGYLQLFSDSYQCGYIHCTIQTMELTSDGVGFCGDKPKTSGEWCL
jgi:hypothetical protein